MRDWGTRILPLTVAALAGAIGGYFLGFGGARSASRASEAAVDLLTPATDFRDDRVRHDALRARLRRMRDLQIAYFADSASYAPDDVVLEGSEGFFLRAAARTSRPSALEGRKVQKGWIAVLTHEESPAGEACAVALGAQRVYAGGIPLRKEGTVRCSWDLATRLNRLW